MTEYEAANLAVQQSSLALQEASLAIQRAALAVQRASVWVAALAGAAQCSLIACGLYFMRQAARHRETMDAMEHTHRENMEALKELIRRTTLIPSSPEPAEGDARPCLETTPLPPFVRGAGGWISGWGKRRRWVPGNAYRAFSTARSPGKNRSSILLQHSGAVPIL